MSPRTCTAAGAKTARRNEKNAIAHGPDHVKSRVKG